MQPVLTITKALADESRLRILRWLAEGELCLCQIVAMIELAPSTVSRHVGVLVQSGLVESRKDGKWTYYQLSHAKEPAIIRQTHKWLAKVACEDEQSRADLKRLKQIRQQDPSQLCEITYGKSDT
ncbi:MAG: transcriptional regulator [Phycisphaeraceae bacterium]|nr:transcriptional regulator [Phycisphaeraceae bacterium]